MGVPQHPLRPFHGHGAITQVGAMKAKTLTLIQEEIKDNPRHSSTDIFLIVAGLDFRRATVPVAPVSSKPLADIGCRCARTGSQRAPHRGETATVLRAGPMLGQRRQVGRRGITLVEVETILRVLLM